MKTSNDRMVIRCISFIDRNGRRLIQCIDHNTSATALTEVAALNQLHSLISNDQLFSIQSQTSKPLFQPRMKSLPELWMKYNDRTGHGLNAFYSHYIESKGLSIQFKIIRVRMKEFLTYCK